MVFILRKYMNGVFFKLLIYFIILIVSIVSQEIVITIASNRLYVLASTMVTTALREFVIPKVSIDLLESSIPIVGQELPTLPEDLN
jgi:ABC-type transport system involved in cytochrome bd biosynthesis fused ATPase/permease subunit